MPATFRTKHHRSDAPRYMRWIPEALQDLFNGKTRITKLLKPMPAKETARALRALGNRDDALFSDLERLPPERKAAIIAAGGIEAVKARLHCLSVNPEDHAPESYLLSDEPLEGIDPAHHDAVRLGMLAQLREQRAELVQRDELLKLAPIVLKSAPSAEYSLDGLFTIWVRVKACKITRKHAATLGLFKGYMGAVDFRNVTTDHVQGFCDHLAQTGHTHTGQTKHLDNLRGLFSATVPRYRKDNPARGVKADGRADRTKKLPFTGSELRTVLEKAESTKFGGKRHEEVMWLLRCAIWTGARINEIAQLRKDDVTTESGIPIIHFKATETSAGKSEPRKVPLAPALGGFLAYAKAAKGEFVFGAFKNDPTNGRAAWLISNFGAFMRDVCGISGNKTQHSIRHRFHDAMDNAGIALERQHVIVGHVGGDVHSRYGQGAGLKQLALDVAKLQPLAD